MPKDDKGDDGFDHSSKTKDIEGSASFYSTTNNTSSCLVETIKESTELCNSLFDKKKFCNVDVTEERQQSQGLAALKGTRLHQQQSSIEMEDENDNTFDDARENITDVRRQLKELVSMTVLLKTDKDRLTNKIGFQRAIEFRNEFLPHKTRYEERIAELQDDKERLRGEIRRLHKREYKKQIAMDILLNSIEQKSISINSEVMYHKVDDVNFVPSVMTKMKELQQQLWCLMERNSSSLANDNNRILCELAAQSNTNGDVATAGNSVSEKSKKSISKDSATIKKDIKNYLLYSSVDDPMILHQTKNTSDEKESLNKTNNAAQSLSTCSFALPPARKNNSSQQKQNAGKRSKSRSRSRPQPRKAAAESDYCASSKLSDRSSSTTICQDLETRRKNKDNERIRRSQTPMR
eukprot:CAMPEP_0194268400 /NCGR_PEP_ID=MMETSP0169-20130528/2740_1 /TAXON_ID=218684 /ORGANISM="Corethron pennatum, Strain L29A3" /LENGTH=406 /DNA_ID=CAMNT_0039009625 /DNA_START=193 /DNA_END=1409 /DNA_ORIENTATION=-